MENRWYKIQPETPIPGRAYHKTYFYKESIYIIGGIDCTGKTVSKVIKFNLSMYNKLISNMKKKKKVNLFMFNKYQLQKLGNSLQFKDFVVVLDFL